MEISISSLLEWLTIFSLLYSIIWALFLFSHYLRLRQTWAHIFSWAISIVIVIQTFSNLRIISGSQVSSSGLLIFCCKLRWETVCESSISSFTSTSTLEICHGLTVWLVLSTRWVLGIHPWIRKINISGLSIISDTWLQIVIEISNRVSLIRIFS